MRDVLPELERWAAEGLAAATATVVRTERSAPRAPGAVLGVSERGEVVGSVTGGCVEPAVYEEAREVLSGAPPRLVTYGIADEEAFEVGLPCGGTVHIFVDALDPGLLPALSEALAAERPVALVVPVSGPEAGRKRLVFADQPAADGKLEEAARTTLARGESTLVTAEGVDVFVQSFAPRPQLYVFGAVDHAAAIARQGRFLGYRVTVCDARAKFATPERFPEADELVVEWPDRFLADAPVDVRTAICVLTHEERFDVPLLQIALRTPAGYIGAMGARRTNERRAERLREAGVSDEAIARIHAPIGLDIGSRTPEEVAVSVAAEIVAVMRGKAAALRPAQVAS
ncbi:MAG: XdhC family protein [Actinobacteria bacterium]|nr:XdhC family protein [Actinomycetota bacterium]